jgi:2',3'-cyclic-nucleotide 2'-phosphodiesterase (5'-nucleotidase family)
MHLPPRRDCAHSSLASPVHINSPTLTLLSCPDELDFGEQRCAKLAGECAFPWLQSNLKKIVGGGTLPGTAESALLTCGPWRVGVIGLIASDWLEASSCAYLCRHYTLEEPLQAALRLSKDLRAQGAHLVVALTHMHLSEDKALALALTAAAATAGAPVIDLVLGGHDHEVAHSVQPGAVPLLKSGNDFTLCSVVQVWGAGGAEGSTPPLLPSPHQHLPAHLPPGAFLQPLPPGPPLPLLASSGRALLQAALLPITAAVPPDSSVAALVAAEYSRLGEASPVLAQVLGMSSVPLNLVESDTRSKETNFGNLLADLMRASVDADCALLNSGSLRSNRVLGPGFLRYGDMVSLLPKYTDIVVKLRVKGRDLLQALNHSVGSLPSPSGKFLQVSGLRFSYDLSSPTGERVKLGSVQILKRRPKAAGASPAAPSPACSQGGAGAMGSSSSSSGGATSGGGSSTPGEHFGGLAEDSPCAPDGSLREAAFVGCVHKLGQFRLREVTLDSKAAEQALLWELLSARPLHNPLVGRTPEESRAHYEVEDWELAEYAQSLRGLYGPASELLGEAGSSSKHAHGTPLHAAAAWMSAGGLEESEVERWEPLVEEESYTLATKDYLISGGDGYKWLDETSPENWDHHVQ